VLCGYPATHFFSSTNFQFTSRPKPNIGPLKFKVSKNPEQKRATLKKNIFRQRKQHSAIKKTFPEPTATTPQITGKIKMVSEAKPLYFVRVNLHC
jgi:hypothetical protein